MRRLLLLRHGKSSWSDPAQRDHDRPLNERGRAAARLMGDALRRDGLLPELVLCSSSRRTCETLAQLRLPDDSTIEIGRDLYLAEPDTVLDRVHAVDDGVGTLMVVGHNPTTQDLAVALAGSGARDALARMTTKYPTAALAVLRFTGAWSEVGPGGASLERFLTPRELQ